MNQITNPAVQKSALKSKLGLAVPPRHGLTNLGDCGPTDQQTLILLGSSSSSSSATTTERVCQMAQQANTEYFPWGLPTDR